MIAFRVDDMTCGHCAGTITRALQAVDEHAEVAIDLGKRLVTVEAGRADAQRLREAIAAAGYTPLPAA